MSFFHLKNWKSHVVADSPAPWDSTSKRPEFADKDSYRVWCEAESTAHYFYSAFEGINQSVRVTKENYPYRMHALVADYDCSTARDAALALIAKNSPTEFRPAWISTTFSGGVRLVWDFEEPVFCHNPAALKAFLTRLKLQFKCAKLCPGLDDNILKPEQYYELGTDWQRYSDVRIPTKVLNLWAYEAGKKVKWSTEGDDIPIEIVAAEVEKQFPGRWPGTFEEGARGPRFWDMTADNETAAIVRSAGMQCFTGGTPFAPWGSILGASFTTGFKADQIASATDQIYYDNKMFWQRDDNGNWYPGNNESLRLYLRVHARLSPQKVNSTCSAVDEAVFHIQRNHRVIAALPFVHRQKGLHREPDGLYLNTSNVNVCPPADGTQSWGEDFPWLAKFFDGFFSSPDQNDYFYAWFQRFYKTAYEGNMLPGHTLFLAGGVQKGKTLLSTRILAPALGGAAPAANYLQGNHGWNSHLFSRALWTVDDPEASEDPKKKATYSANIKKHVADQDFDFQQKFQDGARVTWTGRTVITINDDEVSLGMLPEMGISIMDKVMLFRMCAREFDFTDCEKFISKELPFFLRWLNDWTPPAHTKGDSRYGIKAYHEPSLLQSAHERGVAHMIQELLEVFLLHYFRADRDKQEWGPGTATQLYGEMAMIEGLKTQIHKLNSSYLGRGLRAMLSRENPQVTYVRRQYTISRGLLDGAADEQPGCP